MAHKDVFVTQDFATTAGSKILQGYRSPFDATVVAKLAAAYAEGAKAPEFVELMDNRGFTMMGISGAEADAFLAKWQQGTTWLLQDAGLTKASPEAFGIARPTK